MVKSYIYLNLIFIVYSISGVFTKLAGLSDFLSLYFFIYYAGSIFVLGIYAIAWQQVIKKIPLSNAFANKSITIFWNMLWGIIFFNDFISVWKIIGAVIVVLGIVLYSFSDNKN